MVTFRELRSGAGGQVPGGAMHRFARAVRATRSEGFAGATLGAATLAMGLIAGVFYSFACSVMLGLARTDDRTFIEVMQRINEEIINPVFFSSFFGALVLSIVALVLQRRLGAREATRWIAAALALYALVLVVTMAANVPLNDALAAAGDPHTISDPASVRHQFEGPWVAWNIVRGAASLLALGCLARALVLHGRTARAKVA